MLTRSLTAGPGSLTKALGICLEHSGISLTSNVIWIEDHGHNFSDEEIIASPRVGVAFAQEHATLPLRFRLKNNSWTSIAK